MGHFLIRFLVNTVNGVFSHKGPVKYIVIDGICHNIEHIMLNMLKKYPIYQKKIRARRPAERANLFENNWGWVALHDFMFIPPLITDPLRPNAIY